MVTLAAALIAILVFASPNSATAAFPGANGRIAYVGGEYFSSGIFTIRSDGSGVKALATQAINPSWSADGRRIVFERSLDGTAHLFTMKSDGGDQTDVAAIDRIVSGAKPSFSPSGNRIAYTAPGAIRTVRADGAGSRRVIAGHPRWGIDDASYSPDGERIVFTGVPRGKSPEKPGIWTARSDGTRLRRLTDPKSIDDDLVDYYPDFSPDGRHILFLRSGDADHVVVMRADGSREGELPTNPLSYPAYAPDGRRIVGSYRPPGAQTCSDLYILSPRLGTRAAITGNCAQGGGNASMPSWQPRPGSG